MYNKEVFNSVRTFFPGQLSGILQFESAEQWEGLYQGILEIDETWNNSTHSQNERSGRILLPDEPLEALENELKFRSLRFCYEAQFEAGLACGMNPFSADPIPDGGFYNPLRMALLSPEAEWIIGDSYFKMLDAQTYAEIQNPTEKKVELIRSLGLLNYHHATGDPIDFHTGEGSGRDYTSPAGACTLNLSYTRHAGSCNSLDFTFYTELWTDSGNILNNSPLDIDWGDGTTESTHTGSTTHTFPGFGTYHVKFEAMESGNALCSGLWENDIHIVANGCEKANRYPAWIGRFCGTNHVLKGRAWVACNYDRDIGAESRHFKKINGIWKERKTDQVVVQWWGDIFSDNCATGKHEVGAEWKNNASRARRVRHLNYDFGIRKHSIRANHRAKVNGQTYQLDQEIWSSCA